MAKLSTHRTLIAGILSPILAAALGAGVYMTLTRASADRDADFVFRLTLTAIAMGVPFLLTSFLAMSDRRRSAFTTSGKIGLTLAVLSLALAWLPVKGLYDRVRQANNLALSGVAAPLFDTVDINGNQHRLADHEGKVVLVNIWATWCTPCRREMPDLERLYQERKDDGFMIFGISTEDLPTQQKFAEEVVVSYPLLTIEGDVPDLFTQTARYPANFLIDRNGRLQPAPSVDQPFENLEAAVDALLQAGAES
jgi:peroxiredoxin